MKINNNFYCTICGKLQENTDIEDLEIKSDDGILSLTLVRLRCSCNNGNLQTIRIYRNNDDKNDRQTPTPKTTA